MAFLEGLFGPGSDLPPQNKLLGLQTAVGRVDSGPTSLCALFAKR